MSTVNYYYYFKLKMSTKRVRRTKEEIDKIRKKILEAIKAG